MLEEVVDVPDTAAALDALSSAIHASRGRVDVAYWAHRLSIDPQFAAEMALCKKWGLAHSTFKSWSPEDQEKALGYELHEARRCNECGMHPDDWPDEGTFDQAPPFIVEASRCYGCLALHDFQVEWRKANTVGNEVNERAMKGVRTRFTRTTTET